MSLKMRQSRGGETDYILFLGPIGTHGKVNQTLESALPRSLASAQTRLEDPPQPLTPPPWHKRENTDESDGLVGSIHGELERKLAQMAGLLQCLDDADPPARSDFLSVAEQ